MKFLLIIILLIVPTQAISDDEIDPARIYIMYGVAEERIRYVAAVYRMTPVSNGRFEWKIFNPGNCKLDGDMIKINPLILSPTPLPYSVVSRGGAVKNWHCVRDLKQ